MLQPGDFVPNLELIQENPFFAGVSKETLTKITELCCQRLLRCQEVLVSQGESIDHFYILCDGELELTMDLDTEERLGVKRLQQGDFYGEICLLTGEPSDVNIVALKKSTLLVFDKQGFVKLTKLLPTMNEKVIKTLSAQLNRVNEEKIAAKSRELALAKLLTESKYMLPDLIGKSKFVRSLRHQINERARDVEPLLITGEKGTGKVLIANLIHRASKRKGKPFIVVECGELLGDSDGDKIFNTRWEVSGRYSYLELVQGGTLVLNNIELLPANVLGNLINYLNHSREVRFMMTSTLENPLTYIAAKIPGADCDALFGSRIHVESLRKRKRDIPQLITHFVKETTCKYQKPGQVLSQEALEKLLAYDYRQANIKELAEIIERAVILTDGPVISADAILLGVVSGPYQGADLLKVPLLKRLLQNRIWPKGIQIFVTLVFGLVTIGCFWGGITASLINQLTWFYWGPVIVVAALVLGRVPCSVCPFSYIASRVQRVRCYQKNIPPLLTKHYYVILLFLFALIFWYEEFFNLRASPFLTGCLFLALTLGAVICGVLYSGDVWCRYLCPLGAIISTCATLAVVELRAKTDLCLHQCQTYNCYKGGGTAGCPLMQHAMYIDSNMNCKFCFQCFLNCPQQAIKFNLRPPGREIWTVTNMNSGMAVVVAGLGMMLLPPLLKEPLMLSFPGQWQSIFQLIYWLTFACLVVGCVVLFKRSAIFKKGLPFTRLIFSLIPLIAAGHCAYQLSRFTSLAHYQLVNSFSPQRLPLIDINTLLQMLLMVGGLLFTLVCIFHNRREIRPIGVKWALVMSLTYYLVVSSVLWYY